MLAFIERAGSWQTTLTPAPGTTLAAPLPAHLGPGGRCNISGVIEDPLSRVGLVAGAQGRP